MNKLQEFEVRSSDTSLSDPIPLVSRFLLQSYLWEQIEATSFHLGGCTLLLLFRVHWEGRILIHLWQSMVYRHERDMGAVWVGKELQKGGDEMHTRLLWEKALDWIHSVRGGVHPHQAAQRRRRTASRCAESPKCSSYHYVYYMGSGK